MQRRPTIVLFALALAVTGCGGSSSAGGNSGGQLKLAQPIKIAFLVATPAVSPVAHVQPSDGAMLAAADINAAGGVGGQKIDVQIIPTPTDPVGASNAFLRALDMHPTAMVGLSLSAQAVALVGKINQADVPFLHLNSADQVFKRNGTGGDLQFVIRPDTSKFVSPTVDWASKKFGAKKFGLICAESPFGSSSCTAARAEIAKLGAKVVADRTSPNGTTTDMTAQVIAVKSGGADVVLDYSLPGVLVVEAQQFIDAGYSVPIVSPSADSAVAIGALGSAALKNLYGAVDCVPLADPRSEVKQWSARYKAAAKSTITPESAEGYDGITLVVQAIKKTGSTSPSAIGGALGSIEYQGICANYQSDKFHGLSHQTSIDSFRSDRTAVVVQALTIPVAR